MSVRSQIDQFKAASAVVGPHGAGLTTILFIAQPGTPVVVMPVVGERYGGAPYFRHLAEVNGLRYVTVQDVASPRTSNFSSPDPASASQTISRALIGALRCRCDAPRNPLFGNQRHVSGMFPPTCPEVAQ